MLNNTIIHENRAYWSERASSYSEVNHREIKAGSHICWQELLDEKISTSFPNRTRENIRILDVGTGPGLFSILMAELGYSVTAIDLTPNMLSEARINAGIYAEKINFMEMNAEQLEFDDNSFDVIMTRNLTWNLPHPEKAYGEWVRVLDSDGLLLNFDANWYSYLYDENAKASYEHDREKSASLNIKDENVGENFDVMEDIARRIPLSKICRPAWDVSVLNSLGMYTETDEHIWQRVWNDDEKINFASTLMFLVEAHKYEN